MFLVNVNKHNRYIEVYNTFINAITYYLHTCIYILQELASYWRLEFPLLCSRERSKFL